MELNKPYVRIWVHLIWSTKNWKKLISNRLKPKLLTHIPGNAKEKEIYIDQINKVRAYIKNHEEHHRKKSFKEEYDLLMKKYGFKYLG